AGLPKGVLNIITGDGAVGEMIVKHPDIHKIAFTGSTEVGRRIRTATAGSGKALTLELGGKSPFIIFDDADLDSAVEGVVDAIWFNQGQVCCAGSRLLLQESIAERMIEKLKTRMETLRVGDPLDKAIDIGAIVAPVQLARIEELVAQGVAEGATLWQPSWSCPKDGCFYPPSLFTGVAPASTIVQEEIFGPVLVAMSFRTPEEAVALANNTRYGLAASVWTESINLALDMAPKIKAGVVWVNSTNLFDAACGFGGYRESGYGREGGREGLYAYLQPSWTTALPQYEPVEAGPVVVAGGTLDLIDRTAKNYIGGKQKRPDSGYARAVVGADGRALGDVGEGNRKDIRDAVEAAHKAAAWAKAVTHLRAQILFYMGENLAARAPEFRDRIMAMTGVKRRAATNEVEAAVSRLFFYAAWADKFDGAVHSPPIRDVTLAMHEPVGVLGIICPDEAPLLAMISLVAPAIAMGNRVVVVPSPRHPLSATDFIQVLETSDLPGGVVNIVTGERDDLAKVLADHDGVEGLWYVGPKAGSAMVQKHSVGNLKQTWVNDGKRRDWFDPRQGEGRDYLRHATQVKNIWVPYGE
ncbi:MAG: aldehyde dehydrogenase family protein, partial [Alphaproteobacteria bacterium]